MAEISLEFIAAQLDAVIKGQRRLREDIADIKRDIADIKRDLVYIHGMLDDFGERLTRLEQRRG